MKQVTIIFLVLVVLNKTAVCQSHWQFSLGLGPTFTTDVKYQNSIGHIPTTFTVSPAFIYRPIQALGIELRYSGMSKALAYLDHKNNSMLQNFSSSHITLSRILTGLNFYLPLKKNIKPFLGILAGASYVEEDVYYPNNLIKFNWGFQLGTSVQISKLIALRLDGTQIYIPNVSNNSTFFGGVSDGGDTPVYLIGVPSKATIKQLNINLAIVLHINKSKKQ